MRFFSILLLSYLSICSYLFSADALSQSPSSPQTKQLDTSSNKTEDEEVIIDDEEEDRDMDDDQYYMDDEEEA